jgi:SAM-dependent methyltransferase
MPSAKEHYSTLLAHHYTWMFGISFDEKVAEQQAILGKAFAAANFTPAASIPSRLAIDLGSGPGFQTFALANLGFTSILAVDTSPELLAELESHRTTQPIRTALADIRSLSTLTAATPANAIVCMGDTLTHLPTKFDVTALFQAAFNALTPGGIFILTWRDLTPELTGPDRFIPVRSDDTTVMTCFLEYTTPDTVHDLVYTRQPGTSAWTLNKSSYPKLRLSPDLLTTQLTQTGFKVHPTLALTNSLAFGGLNAVLALRPHPPTG